MVATKTVASIILEKPTGFFLDHSAEYLYVTRLFVPTCYTYPFTCVRVTVLGYTCLHISDGYVQDSVSGEVCSWR